MPRQVFIGSFAHSDESGELILVNRGAITVEGGKITSVLTDDEAEKAALDVEDVTVLRAGQFLTPGFIDCHTHAVQFPNLGLGYDKTLLNWLDEHTYPLERLYIDEKFAAEVFDTVVERTLMMGTTTASYFASLYAGASAILAQKAAGHGQRAFVGKMNMNAPRSDGYYESTRESVDSTRRFIKGVADIGSPLVNPIITPRFPLSCDMELMKELGDIAREQNLRIQSHISENADEVCEVKRAYSGYSSYAAIYDAAGLLTNKTILAHGVHLTNDEIKLLKKRDTAIIHCPSSNICLKSGLCDVQKWRRSGLKIGLGTGGNSASMLSAMRAALQVSYQISMLQDNYETLTYKDVFHMATMGGAKSLAIDDKVGNFLPGKEFDALIIDSRTSNGVRDNFLNYTLEEQLQRFIYSGDDRKVAQVYVSGRKVKSG